MLTMQKRPPRKRKEATRMEMGKARKEVKLPRLKRVRARIQAMATLRLRRARARIQKKMARRVKARMKRATLPLRKVKARMKKKVVRRVARMRVPARMRRKVRARTRTKQKEPRKKSPPKARTRTKKEEAAPAPELGDAGEQKDEGSEPQESSEDGEGGSYPALAAPPSFYDLEEYSFETISMTSCQKIDFAFAYLTSLEFDGSVVKNAKKKQDDSKFWSDIYIVEMVVLPTSLILAFCGSSLLMPASLLTAAGFGTFLIFHFVSGAFGGLECKLKLGLSAVSAGACAFLAMKFVRFGLFTLGAFSSGLASYLFFDSFPAFDPGQNFFDVQGLVSDASYLNSVMKHSDISQAAWAIIVVLALFTGICIRVYEHGSVEVLTALLGGTGTGYAIHAHILVHGGSLNRSFVFVIAGLVGTLGWRFQRRRRIGSRSSAKGQELPLVNANTPSNGATWNQLQKSIDTTNAMLQKQGDDQAAAELSGLLNNFQKDVKERGKDN
mmetsp:Transcript_43368/g.104822  ORF Transcript_43368/g.104822 Transcript_43368/m.104822 type:complete len:497 (-) Transcript_43368:107-1597(-)